MRLLVVEDDPDLNRQLVAALSDAGYAVDTAFDGEEGHYLGANEPYDAVVLDLGLPKKDGLSVLEQWRRDDRKMPVLILTTFDDHSLVQKCLEAGASAYLLKDIHPDDLVNAIRLLLAGERLIPGDLARTLSETDDIPAEPLTPRQREVLSLIAQGLTNKEIAKQLYLSEGTVKNIVSEIYARLNVRDRVQAVLKSLGEI